MNFFEKISALLVGALNVANANRKALLEAAVNAIANVQRVALKFDELVGIPGASADLGDGLIELAGLIGATFPNLTDDQIGTVKDAIKKTVSLPDPAAETAAEDFFNTLVDALKALKALEALTTDENTVV